MTIKVGINGYGRIGRNVLRAIYESGRQQDIRVVAINDLGDVATNVHLTRFDSTHGRFPGEVRVDGGDMLVDADRIRVLTEPDPARLPWGDLGVDLVMECTGLFASREKASAHLTAGAGKVLLSQPAGDDVKTIVYGINHDNIATGDTLISNASCTTNCLAPLLQPIDDAAGIVSGIMTTVHAFTNGQVLTDSFHDDLRRARAATQSMIPTKTGAIAALARVLPEFRGRIDGFAVRVPTLNVSLVDLNLQLRRAMRVDEINALYRAAAKQRYPGVLAYSEEPLVSVDYNHHPASGIFDATLTRAGGTLVKLCAWYDNEWGFSNRMIDTAMVMMEQA